MGPRHSKVYVGPGTFPTQ